MAFPEFIPDIQHDRAEDDAHDRDGDLLKSTRGQDAFGAVLQADSVLASSFPGTLSPAIAPLEWIGYARIPERVLEACAVAYLGSDDGVRGWWLHYTRRVVGYGEDGDVHHVVTLIAPCTCGTYITAEISDEHALVLMLDEIRTKPGAPVDCDYRLRIRANSYADFAHSSVETAF